MEQSYFLKNKSNRNYATCKCQSSKEYRLSFSSFIICHWSGHYSKMIQTVHFLFIQSLVHLGQMACSVPPGFFLPDQENWRSITTGLPAPLKSISHPKATMINLKHKSNLARLSVKPLKALYLGNSKSKGLIWFKIPCMIFF